MYKKLTQQDIQEIIKIVGKDNFILPTGDIEPYTHDETEDLQFTPEIVIKPQNKDQIAGIMKLASKKLIPVTPRGAGTGLSGGALAVHGGILLSVEKMNKIIEIDHENLIVIVEPAVITQVLQETVEKVGLFYPPDPASRGSCMIGGNIAENAGGPHALKYGVTRDYVLGLEIVLPNGEIINTGGKLLKNATGYNLTQLIIGSEGTLGIVTKIILKLIPLPLYKKALLAGFTDIVSAAKTVPAIFNNKITPSACEFMEQGAIQVAEKKKGEKFPLSEHAALLLIEVDGNDQSILENEIQKIGEICIENGAADVILADETEKMNRIWAMRRSIGEAVKSISPYKEEDTVVPRSKLPELMEHIKTVCGKYKLQALSYGHIGDGNIHVNILKMNMSDEDWNTKLDEAIQDLFKRVVSLGGMISGEHGIGYVQKNYLPIAIDKEQIELMRQIKKVFDPTNVLNPGKIFPDTL